VGLLAVRRWRLRLSRPAAWAAVAVAVGVAALAAVAPVRAYLADAQRQQGREAEGRGNLLTAESYYRAVVRLAPGNGEYRRDLGRVLGAPRGIAELERAIALEPTNALNYVVLAKLYDMVGPWNEAAARYQRAIELYPNYLIAYRGLAELEARRGRPGNALTLYRRMIAIEHSPYERYRALEQRVEAEYAYAHYALGREALERGDARTARTELERALEILRRREAQGAPMLLALQAAGDHTPAIERELAALRARIWWRLAQLWERAGDRQQADSLRVQARQLAPEVERLVEEEPLLRLKPTPQTSNHGGATDAPSRSGTG
jgi:tetratricopeptide (TPR) repeat protein